MSTKQLTIRTQARNAIQQILAYHKRHSNNQIKLIAQRLCPFDHTQPNHCRIWREELRKALKDREEPATNDLQQQNLF